MSFAVIRYGTASNIKSRVNRLSVLGAITSTQQRLKLYSKVPPNGLVMYCGLVVGEDGKERKMNVDFEPFKVNPHHDAALSGLTSARWSGARGDQASLCVLWRLSLPPYAPAPVCACLAPLCAPSSPSTRRSTSATTSSTLRPSTSSLTTTTSSASLSWTATGVCTFLFHRAHFFRTRYYAHATASAQSQSSLDVPFSYSDPGTRVVRGVGVVRVGSAGVVRAVSNRRFMLFRYGTLQGSTRDVLHKFSVDLPKKHGRGGQSALRFARLRLEKRQNYVRKVQCSAKADRMQTANRPQAQSSCFAPPYSFHCSRTLLSLLNQCLSILLPPFLFLLCLSLLFVRPGGGDGDAVFHHG